MGAKVGSATSAHALPLGGPNRMKSTNICSPTCIANLDIKAVSGNITDRNTSLAEFSGFDTSLVISVVAYLKKGEYVSLQVIYFGKDKTSKLAY